MPAVWQHSAFSLAPHSLVSGRGAFYAPNYPEQWKANGLMVPSDKGYSGSIPAFYDHYLGPMLFDPYAVYLASRVTLLAPSTVLETAAGTGILTARLSEVLPDAVSITATDLNQAMLDTAASKVAASKITWQVCDATFLPFADETFDCVVCQFGVMFFPSKVAAYKEARRVLRPGGRLLFSVWDKIESNPIPHTVAAALAERYPADPPNFQRRTPYGHNDVAAITDQLSEAGYGDIQSVVVTLPSHCPSPRDAAVGSCQGSPLGAEIEARDPTGLAAAIDAAAIALAARFGEGPITSTMQAIVFTAVR